MSAETGETLTVAWLENASGLHTSPTGAETRRNEA